MGYQLKLKPFNFLVHYFRRQLSQEYQGGAGGRDRPRGPPHHPRPAHHAALHEDPQPAEAVVVVDDDQLEVRHAAEQGQSRGGGRSQQVVEVHLFFGSVRIWTGGEPRDTPSFAQAQTGARAE